MLRYRDLPTHTTDVLDLTSLTVDEFTALVPAFEAAFLSDMADWTLHGRRRQARRYTTDKNCPLPTPEERLLFILVYLKHNPTQLRHGHVFGMRQSKATPWIHVLLTVLRHALRTLGEAPSRRVAALCARLGLDGPSLPLEAAAMDEGRTAPPPAAPLVVMMAPSAPSRAPTTRLHRKLAIAASKGGTCSKTSC